MDNMEKLVKKYITNLLRKNNTKNKLVTVAQITILLLQIINVYHQTLFIQLKFSLVTLNKETNILISARQNSKSDQVTIKIHLQTDNKKDTEPSKYICELKDKNITNYSIKWSIIKQTSGYNSITNSCNLCLSEKFVILETKTV